MTQLILIALVLLSGVAAADELTEAEQLYNEGQAAFDAKRLDEAVVAWERSYVLSNEPALLFNIGQAYRQRAKAGDCTKALANYRKFVELDAASEQRPVAEGFMADLRACVAREAPTPIAVPVAVAVSAIPVETPIATPPVNDTRPRRTKQIIGLTLVGGGVALAATGIYFGRRASTLGGEVTSACDGGCDWAIYGPRDAEGKRAQVKQYVFASAGAAAIVGGGVLYWFGRRDVTVTTQRGGAVVAWSGSW